VGLVLEQCPLPIEANKKVIHFAKQLPDDETAKKTANTTKEGSDD